MLKCNCGGEFEIHYYDCLEYLKCNKCDLSMSISDIYGLYEKAEAELEAVKGRIEKEKRVIWECLSRDCNGLPEYGEGLPYICSYLDNGHNEGENLCCYEKCPKIKEEENNNG